jgi:ATP-dependent Zn protease
MELKTDSMLEDIRAMVRDCRCRSSKLKKTNIYLLERLESKLVKGETFTPSQIDSLNTLWGRVTKDG